MSSSIVIPMIGFASVFLVFGVASLVGVLKSRKKLRSLYTESMAYIHAEFDYNACRLLLASSILGLIITFFAIMWSV